METSFLKSIQNSLKHWYLPLIVGIFFVFVGVMAFTKPVGSLLALSLLFAVSFFFGGIADIIFAITNKDQLDNWGWTLALGIITVIAGVLLLMSPALSITTLAFFIGFIVLFRSVSTIGFAMDIKKYGSKGWGWLLVMGILGTIVSFVLIYNPVFAGMTMVSLVALSFLFTGFFSIFSSFQLRKLHKSSKKISVKLRERYDSLMEEIREEWDD